mmetsp:Transcript_2802/g.3854  ORF Transcript_2802/g.3854 Transcript_2802/m.3854 type:complete len:112 (-) Transcript_2802:605-940(-)
MTLFDLCFEFVKESVDDNQSQSASTTTTSKIELYSGWLLFDKTWELRGLTTDEVCTVCVCVCVCVCAQATSMHRIVQIYYIYCEFRADPTHIIWNCPASDDWDDCCNNTPP